MEATTQLFVAIIRLDSGIRWKYVSSTSENAISEKLVHQVVLSLLSQSIMPCLGLGTKKCLLNVITLEKDDGACDCANNHEKCRMPTVMMKKIVFRLKYVIQDRISSERFHQEDLQKTLWSIEWMADTVVNIVFQCITSQIIIAPSQISMDLLTTCFHGENITHTYTIDTL